MGKFNFISTPLAGLQIIEPTAFGDERGFFMEFYNLADFRKAGIALPFVQDNHSKSESGVLRGLHYQLNPHAQGKLVRVVGGEIYDVAVDLRKGSPSFRQWHAVILSSENKQMLYLPPGFAHGFLSLVDDTEVLYKCTDLYDPASEKGIIWNDHDLAIDWPLQRVKSVKVSEKDQKNPPLAKAENNFLFA